MRLFLDANVVLAACGRPAGASRAIFDRAMLLTSRYVLTRKGSTGPFHSSGVGGSAFDAMGTGFYGLEVLTPGNFLERERAAGRLQ